MRGVDAFDVKGWIGFGIAQLLGFGEYIIKSSAFVAHFTENEITSAVNNTGYAGDAVTGKSFANCLNDWNAASYCGFIADSDALFMCRSKQLIALFCDERLVSSDQVFAIGDGLLTEFQSKLGTAHQLDNDVDVGMTHQGCRVANQLYLAEVAVTRFGWISDAGVANGHRSTDAGGNLFGVAVNEFYCCSTNSA